MGYGEFWGEQDRPWRFDAHQLGDGQGVHAWVLAIMKDGRFGDAGDGGWVVPFKGHLVREMGGGRARDVRRLLVVSSLLSLPFNVHYCLVFIASCGCRFRVGYFL